MADVIRQRVSSDVIRLDKRRVEKIAQRDPVARLKADEIFAGAGKCFRRDRGHLVQVARFFLRPIEHHHRSRHLGEAADLAFVFYRLLLEDVTGLQINDRVSFRRVQRTASGQTEAKETKNDGKTAHDIHGKIKTAAP